MKKNLLLKLIIIMAIYFTSCSVTQYTKFTSVEKLYNLKLGSTLETVISSLGSKPYNILSSQFNGYTIYVYNYKLIERKLSSGNIINEIGGETAGRDTYNSKNHTVYLFFKEDKLESFITSEGRKNSAALIMLNNTLYIISKDKEKYIILPVFTEEPIIPSTPFSGKNKKK